MMKSRVLCVVLMGLFLMIGSSADAALTGSISGTIVDNTGSPVPGVQVTVVGTGLPGARTDYTRDSGVYRIVLLPPGRYEVRAELTGFKTVEQKNIDVKVNETARVDLTIEVSSFEEVVVVTAEAPVLDTKTTTVGASITREFQERLPGNDSFQAAFTMTGNTVGGSNPNVAGSTRFDNLFLYDGVDTTDPVTNTFSSNLNADAIAEIEVQTGGFSAEYGRAMGGIVNVVTKSGGNQFEGILRFKYLTDALTAEVKDPEIRGESSLKDSREPTLSLGGPILKDKLWFFFSYRRIEYDNSIDVRNEYLGSNTWNLVTKDADELWQFWAGKLTWSINPSHNLDFSFSSDPAEMVGRDTGVTYRPEAHAVREQGGDRYGLNWTYIYSSNLFFDTRIGYFNSSIYIKPENDTGLPSVYDRTARMYYDNYTQINENDRSKTTLAAAATYIKENLMGTHEFKVGFDYQLQEERQFFNYTTGVAYTIDNYGTENESPYQRINYLNPQAEENEGTVYALFVQDTWEVLPGLTLNPGIRYDYSTYKNKVGRTIHTFDDMLAPRLGVAWDVKGDGKSKAFAYFGRYYNPFDLTIVMIDEGPSAITQTWRYDPSNPLADADGYYLYTTTGGDEWKEYKDSNLKPEYTDEFMIGYDQEIMPRWSVGGKFNYRMTRDIIEDVGVWVDDNGNFHPATDVDYNDEAAVDEWNTAWRADGTHYLVTNPDDAYRDYWAFEIHSRARMQKLSMEVSYTYSETTGTNDNTQPGSTSYGHFSVVYDTPLLCKNIDGNMTYDAPHYFKVFLTYELPWQFFISTQTWYKSGYTYNKFDREPVYGSDYVLVDKRGSYRYPDVFMINLSLQKDFDFGKWGMVTGIIDVENVLDNQLVLARVETVRNDDFGRDSGWAGPRSVSFQIKYAF